MSREEETAFGRLLKQYRRSAHLTQETLAERVGYSADYISMLERGGRIPAPATVDALVRDLDLNSQDGVNLVAAAKDQHKAVPIASQLSIQHGPLIGREQ